MLAGIGDKDECGRLVNEAVESGEALMRFEMMVKLQGGDVSYIEDTSKFRKASFSREVYAPADGYITHMDSEKIGLTAVLLGAGREKKDDDINHAAGIIMSRKDGRFCEARRTARNAFCGRREPPRRCRVALSFRCFNRR